VRFVVEGEVGAWMAAAAFEGPLVSLLVRVPPGVGADQFVVEELAHIDSLSAESRRGYWVASFARIDGYVQVNLIRDPVEVYSAIPSWKIRAVLVELWRQGIPCMTGLAQGQAISVPRVMRDRAVRVIEAVPLLDK
jgi:hypothetical protein